MIHLTFALLAGLAVDTNVAGSVYINSPTLFSDRNEVQGETVRGINAEATLKLIADVSDEISTNIKVCYGCHGFEAAMAYVDWSVVDAFNVRVGRFTVPFGEFYLRHDAANHRSATKPLPYSMGRMLRRGEYNLAVLPEPYPDNGIELFGTVGESVEVSYSAFVVAGLKGNATLGDIDFIRSRSQPYADNNTTPAVGGRLVVAFPELPLDAWRWFAVGFSGMWGNYDADDELAYTMGGIDLYTRFSRFNVRGEVMFRRTEIPDRPELFRQTLVDKAVLREGFYGQVDGPVTDHLEWLVRVDGFRRAGPVSTGQAPLDPDTNILRYTLGANILPTDGVKLKLNYEMWRFSEFDDESIVHAGLVGTF